MILSNRWSLHSARSDVRGYRLREAWGLGCIVGGLFKSPPNVYCERIVHITKDIFGSRAVVNIVGPAFTLALYPSKPFQMPFVRRSAVLTTVILPKLTAILRVLFESFTCRSGFHWQPLAWGWPLLNTTTCVEKARINDGYNDKISSGAIDCFGKHQHSCRQWTTTTARPQGRQTEHCCRFVAIGRQRFGNRKCQYHNPALSCACDHIQHY